MLTAQVETTIRCTPGDVLGFVMDIERYAEVDEKIHPVRWARRTGDVTEFACRPKIAGIPAPVVVQYIRLTPGKRVDIGLAPLPRNRIGNRMVRFNASFQCGQATDGTRVVRTLNFDFPSPVRWLAEPVLRQRLQHDVETEMRRAKEYLESADAG